MRDLSDWPKLRDLEGKTFEASDLDFKEMYDDNQVEMGKDIAALANTFGGQILIGTSTNETRNLCKGFHGVDLAKANTAREMYEKMAKERCRPTPVIKATFLPMENNPAKAVVIVNVEPSPFAPVGASLNQTSGGHLVDKAWVFPYRVGSQTEYLQPDQFGRYESMTARRVAAQLNVIPESDRTRVDVRPDGNKVRVIQRMTLKRVDLRANTVVFETPAPVTELAVPLDQVVTVYQSASVPSTWAVFIKGALRNDQRTWVYHPDPE